MNRYHQLLIMLVIGIVTTMSVYGVQVCTYGPELVYNGGFTGSAAGWVDSSNGYGIASIGVNSSVIYYNTNNIVYNGNGVSQWDTASQLRGCPGESYGPALGAGNYSVSFYVIGSGSAGFFIGNGATFYAFGQGSFDPQYTKIYGGSLAGGYTANFTAVYDGQGCGFGLEPIYGSPSSLTYDSVSIREIINCSDVPTSVCGNGIVEGTEECDDGSHNGQCMNSCSSSCTNNTCQSFEPAIKVSGWDCLMNASLICAAYTVYDDAFAGWFILALLLLFQFMIMMKTRSALPGLVIMFLFIGLYQAGLAATLITPMPTMAMGIIYLITTILIGAVLYNVFAKRN